MAKFYIYEDFISPEEQREIYVWSRTQKYQLNIRKNLISQDTFGHRFSKEIRTLSNIPNIMKVVYDRMIKVLALENANPLRYKIVVHQIGSNTENHVDKYCIQYRKFYRSSLLVKSALEGGVFMVDGEPVTFPERSMLNFVGLEKHGVTQIMKGERLLLRANWYRN